MPAIASVRAVSLLLPQELKYNVADAVQEQKRWWRIGMQTALRGFFEHGERARSSRRALWALLLRRAALHAQKLENDPRQSAAQ